MIPLNGPPGAGWEPDVYVDRGDFPSGDPSGLPARLFRARPSPPLRDYVAGYLGFPPDTYHPAAQVVLPRETITLPLPFDDAPGHLISGGGCTRLPAQAVFGRHDHAFWFRPQPSAAITVALGSGAVIRTSEVRLVRAVPQPGPEMPRFQQCPYSAASARTYSAGQPGRSRGPVVTVALRPGCSLAIIDPPAHGADTVWCLRAAENGP